MSRAMSFTYQRNQELPGLRFPWEQADGIPLDLSTGYTIRCEVYARGAAAPVKTKTAGVAGYDGGVTVDWAPADLDLDPGVYLLMIVARDGLNNDRVFSPGRLPTLVIAAPGVTGA